MIDTFNLKQLACVDLEDLGYKIEDIARITGLMERTVKRSIERQRELLEDMRLSSMGFIMGQRTDRALRLLKPTGVADAYLRAHELLDVSGIGAKTVLAIQNRAVEAMGIDMSEEEWPEKVVEWIRENPSPKTRSQMMKELEPGLNALFGECYDDYDFSEIYNTPSGM